MKIGYFDCFAGVSGDMILGALLDAGLSLASLRAELAKLPLRGYQISAHGEQRGAIGGIQVTISIVDSPPRALHDILELIARSSLPQSVVEKGKAIFERLAAAEAKVHRVPINELHFHEVGAVDAIVDVIGAVIGLELLGIEALFSSDLPSGSGTVNTEQGVLPVPAPATLELMAIVGAPLRASNSPEGEAVTPTGAAILTTLASFERPDLLLEGIGYGIGRRHLPHLPNVLPLWIGQRIAPPEEGKLLLFETNIDDMNPELYSYVLERLFAEGACDVWFTPIQMKKNRPAVTLSVLAPSEVEGAIVETVLRETSTLGLRVQGVRRHEAPGELVEFESSLGQVAVRVKRLQGSNLSLAPEYEDCRRLALERGLPLQEVYRIVAAEASKRFLPCNQIGNRGQS